MSQHTHAQRQGGVRRGPRLTANFTVVSNSAINDEQLSFRARGLLSWLLSKPADWRIRSESIARQSPSEGRDAIRSAMRELIDAGYLVVEKVQDEQGRWATVQTIYEQPRSHASPKPEKPTLGATDVGHPGPSTKNGLLQRTETHNDVVSSVPKPDPKHQKLIAALEAATTRAGLVASYARIKPAQHAEIVALATMHGIDTLVAAAKAAHRQTNPTMHVHGWLRLWRAIPAPRPTPPPLCGRCDEYGWLPDDEHGRAVRCACRKPNTETTARGL